MSQKDIAFFAACHEERPLPFDVQLIVQLFSPEMLDLTWILPKANILSKFFTLKCWTRSCTLPTGNVECTRKSRPPQQFSDARLDARLFSLEKSDGNSVFAKNRLFARVFNLKKSDVKSSIEKGTIKKFFRAVTRNPPPSQDKKSCLILRQPLL